MLIASVFFPGRDSNTQTAHRFPILPVRGKGNERLAFKSQRAQELAALRVPLCLVSTHRILAAPSFFSGPINFCLQAYLLSDKFFPHLMLPLLQANCGLP